MNQPLNPLSPQNNPSNQDYRIGDAERQKAMDDLGKHFAAGRLDITEYDNRLTNVAEATMRSDLIPIFSDLPAITDANTPVTIPHATGIPDEVTFTSSEIEESYRSGKRIRLGITLLMLLPFLATFHLETLISGITFIAFLATFIMLYILKLGPKSWHQPAATANRPGPSHAGTGHGAGERATNGAATSPPATTTSRNHRRCPGSD